MVVNGKALKITVDGETKTVTEWAKKTKLSYAVIKHRYDKGIRGKKLFSQPRIYSKSKDTGACKNVDCFNCPFEDCINSSPPYSECKDIELALEKGAKKI